LRDWPDGWFLNYSRFVTIIYIWRTNSREVGNMDPKLKELKDFIVSNNIHIPSDCWKYFMSYLGSLIVACGSTCINHSAISSESLDKTIKCMKEKIPQYEELAKKILELNEFPHGFFTKDVVKLFLVLGYVAWTYDLKDKLDAVLLAYALYMMVSLFRKFFAKGCNPEMLRAAVNTMSKKSVYRKYNLNHIEVAKHVIQYAKRLHTDRADFLFRWMRNIKAHINQLLKTLARAYYRIIQQEKDAYSRGQSVEIDSQSLINMLKLHLPTAFQATVSSANKLGINLNEDQLSCIIDNLDPETVVRLFLVLFRKDENFRLLVTSTKGCNQIKTIYNKVIFGLKDDPIMMSLFKQIAKACNLNLQHYLAFRKIIAFSIVFAWRSSVCH
jgi:hypothetical protein